MKILSVLVTVVAFAVAAARAGQNEPRRPRVAVIGCGPGGMFFLHALATKRKKLKENGDFERLATFPEVTVFEKATSPGGVWKSRSSSGSYDGSPGMMAGLWTNSPSFDMEFFDYTFQQHFNESLPIYLPRQHVLDYMMARVTSVENIFESVQFSTQVDHVEYDEEETNFIVTTWNIKTEIEESFAFDKVVWAGGVLSGMRVPRAIDAMLKRGDYSGTVVHSSQIMNLNDSIKGKRILLVGDSFSAEDLALEAVKRGAAVFIASARQGGVASSMSRWPGNKVDNLKCLPTAVIHNGTGLLCSSIHGYVAIAEAFSRELEDIDAVVYCTGFYSEQDYLDDSLLGRCEKEAFWVEPEWQSRKNSLSRDLGHVDPSDELYSSYVCDNLYRHILVDNPNMMYIATITQYFLPEIDAIAWSLAAYVSGEIQLPSPEEMKRRNRLEQLQELDVPYLRKSIDSEYAQAVVDLQSGSSGHFTIRSKENCTLGYDEYFKERVRYEARLIARDQLAGGHGGGWGSYDGLSERGELFVEQMLVEEFSREFEASPEESDYKTFRDWEPSPPFKSLYTGEDFTSLEVPWMYLNDDWGPKRHACDRSESP